MPEESESTINKNWYFLHSDEEIDVQPGETLIDDIDKNGYLVHDQEEFVAHSGEVNDNDGYDLHDENETEPTNAFTQYDRCSIIGKKFNSSDDAYTFYNEYGLFKGFGIRRHYYNKHTTTNEIYRQVFVCNKQGYKNAKRMKNDGKPRCIKRTGCKATLHVTLSTLGTWVVDKFLDDHNHPLDDPSRVPQQWSHKVFHRTKECRDLVTLLSKTGVRPSEITKIVNVYKGDQDDKLTRVQCSSIINGERKTNLGKECHGIIMHFQQKAATDKDCYFAMDLNVDGTFRSVFWADGRSRSSFNQFGDVVVFDVTYKTHFWVKAYLKDTFFAGMTTSGRSESIHSFFDGYVNSKTMLNDFVVQYDKAVSSRRNAEADEDFRTSNTKPTLDGDHPIEAMAATCYTRNIYEIFKKEWKASSDCGHEKLSKDGDLVKYRVGFLNSKKESWKTVECKVDSEFVATCSCARFETSGILCKHILYIMKRKLITSIPDRYIIPRWTMKATYNVGSTGRWMGVNNHGAEEVSFMSLWSIRAKFNKALEEGRDSLSEIKRLDILLDDFVEEQYTRKSNTPVVDFENDSSAPTVTQVDMSQQFFVYDPILPVKTKGRPKVATRMKSSIEKALEPKKKKSCGYCKGAGHNRTGCQQKKMDESKRDKMAKRNA